MLSSEKVSEYKAQAAEVGATLYDPETRPKKVAEMLVSLGADKVLSKVVSEAKAEMMLEGIASITTLEGLQAKKAEITEIAKPYVAKAYTPDGRQALVAETKELAMPYVEPYVTPVKEYAEAKITAGKEFAAPYITSVKESSYVAKLDEIRRSERVEAMVAAFQEAREHPAEKVGELRAKAVDLIKYEKLQEYRAHVMSAEFQADTIRLVKVDLPNIAKQGADTVRAKATTLADELECHFVAHKAKFKEMVTKGREMASQVELDVLKARVKETSALLIQELQSELLLSVETFKSDGFSVTEAVERLKRVAAVVDKLVITPIKTEVSALAPTDAISNGCCADDTAPDEATNGTPAPTETVSNGCCADETCQNGATPPVAPTSPPVDKAKVVDEESADEPMEDAIDSPDAL